MPSKYHNKAVYRHGQSFDSKHEAGRFTELLLLERGGKISDLRCQVPYELIPAQYDPKTHRCIERAVKYVADFVYTENGHTVVEDAKGMKTDVYRIKKKLMLYRYGIRIRES